MNKLKIDKGRIRRLGLPIAVLLLAVLLVANVGARAKFEDSSGYQTLCYVVEGTGEIWYDDEIMQVRGLEKVYRKTGIHPDLGDADNYITVNYTLNLLTGEGTSWGKFVTVPDEYAGKGTIEGSYSGKISNWLFSGRSTGIGTGELKGTHFKIESRQLGPDDPELAEIENLCGEGQPIEPEVLTVRILWPHGE